MCDKCGCGENLIMLSKEAHGQSGPDMLLVKSISCSLPTLSLRSGPSRWCCDPSQGVGRVPCLWGGGTSLPGGDR